LLTGAPARSEITRPTINRPEITWFDDDTFDRGLRAYVTAVARALGVGAESTTVDTTVPASAYLALDGSLPAYPGRELALLWDERHGWSAAVETASGEDLVVLRHLDPAHGAVPAPRVLVRFVEALRMGRPVGRTDPPDLSGLDRRRVGERLTELYLPR
jgi:hypothetical protein